MFARFKDNIRCRRSGFYRKWR